MFRRLIKPWYDDPFSILFLSQSLLSKYSWTCWKSLPRRHTKSSVPMIAQGESQREEEERTQRVAFCINHSRKLHQFIGLWGWARPNYLPLNKLGKKWGGDCWFLTRGNTLTQNRNRGEDEKKTRYPLFHSYTPKIGKSEREKKERKIVTNITTLVMTWRFSRRYNSRDPTVTTSTLPLITWVFILALYSWSYGSDYSLQRLLASSTKKLSRPKNQKTSTWPFTTSLAVSGMIISPQNFAWPRGGRELENFALLSIILM